MSRSLYKIIPTGLITFVVCFVLGFEVNGQRPASKSTTLIRTAETEKRPAKTVASRFSAAAFENKRSIDSMQWTFAGKPQTGWALYSLLIGETIGSDHKPDTSEFAASLSKWQSGTGAEPTGILDRETLEALIKLWQAGRRLGAVEYVPQLFSAPIADFFDPTRSPDLLQLDRETYSAYKLMTAAAAKDLRKVLSVDQAGGLATNERSFRIISAYRSPEYQEQLRRKEPTAGRGALAKNSVHSTGRALDIYVGGEPVSTKDANRAIQVKTPAYKWLVKNARRFGFRPYFYEPWHWEYVPGK